MAARSFSPTLLFVATILSTFFVPSLVEADCYCKRDGSTFDCSSTETSCGNSSSVDNGAQLCCVMGDTCGEDSLCHFTKTIPNTSGYYLGGCTDPLYEDPVCQQHCIDAGTADVQYNTTSDMWECCAYPNSTVSCEEPRESTAFKAISPAQFPHASSSSTTTSPSTSISSTSTLSASISSTNAAAATTSAGSSSQSSSGLSTGATAGIAVACVIIGIALIGLAVFIVLRGRRRNSRDHNIPETPYFSPVGQQANAGPEMDIKGYYPTENQNNGVEVPESFTQMHEIDGTSVPQQLYGSESRQISELPN